jgi:spore coat protein U-like protein
VRHRTDRPVAIADHSLNNRKDYMMIKKTIFILAAVAALLPASGAVRAAAATTSIAVSANVSQACTISTVSGVAFGNYDPIATNATAPLNATGSISVTCSKGAKGLSIGIDAGAQPAGQQRQMKGAAGSTPLLYNIFQPPSAVPGTACTFPGTTAWTNATGGLLTLEAAPSKAARTYNVCGTIPGGQDVTVEAYSDTVTATLNF